MHDVLVHYLEVNFPEIAEQLAHAHGREPSNEERGAAVKRLRALNRRLRRGAEGAGAAPHAPRASAAEMIAGVTGELSADERAVLDRFFELFARSMQRTQAAVEPEPPVLEAVTAAPPPPVPQAPSAAAPASGNELPTAAAPVVEQALEAPPVEGPTAEPAIPQPTAEEAPSTDAQVGLAAPAPVAPEPPAARLVP